MPPVKPVTGHHSESRFNLRDRGGRLSSEEIPLDKADIMLNQTSQEDVRKACEDFQPRPAKMC